MFDSAPSSAADSASTIEAPAARNVIFEIGLVLAAHLVLALAVTVFLQI